MYMEHFGLTQQPFSLTPNTQFYCGLTAHQSALNVLMIGLNSGEGFIKITGEVGTGKTLLCRKLLDNLNDNCLTAYIPNPDLTPTGLHKAVAQELGINLPSHLDQHSIQMVINEKLIELNGQGYQVVLLIDEAQAMPDTTLETLRLLTNLETESKKLLQIVLFGQPELNQKLTQKNLRQFRQRITFSYHLSPLSKEELKSYLNHRLATAGYTYGMLFTPYAIRLLFHASQGIPRIINILGHKSLMVAYGRNKKQVDAHAMRAAIRDSREIVHSPIQKWLYAIPTFMLILSASLIWHYHLLGK